MQTITYEMTDTFGGEANYSWCERGTIHVPENASRLAIVRAVKREVGWSGFRCKRSDFGDRIDLRPFGICQVLFIDA
jgi:hypothetical protein